MKILYTSVLFLMGLFSSSDWFELYPENSFQSASKKDHPCSKVNHPKVQLIVEKFCPAPINNCKGYNVLVKAQETEVTPVAFNIVWPLYTTNNAQLDFYEKEARPLFISLKSAGRSDVHFHSWLPGKVFMLLE